jgi:hypothetical protein
MSLNHFSKEIKNNWKGTFVFFVLMYFFVDGVFHAVGFWRGVDRLCNAEVVRNLLCVGRAFWRLLRFVPLQ